MSIKIKTEKIIVRGEQKRKLVGFDLLTSRKLPAEYMAAEPRCYIHEDGDLSVVSDHTTMVKYYPPSNTIEEKEFQALLKTIGECSTQLQKINAKLAKENADWHGEETFVI